MSLDGFIAGPNGEADWIEMDPTVDMAAYFRAFYAQFDVAIMGRKSFEPFGGAVEGMDTYVFSRTLPAGRLKDVTVVGEHEGIARLRDLRAARGKDIWLFGGGVLLGSLAAERLVDTVELAIMPVMLGAGHPVLAGNTDRLNLELANVEHSPAGVVKLTYNVRPRR
jgi:dihydrofolate reductase